MKLDRYLCVIAMKMQHYQTGVMTEMIDYDIRYFICIKILYYLLLLLSTNIIVIESYRMIRLWL